MIRKQYAVYCWSLSYLEVKQNKISQGKMLKIQMRILYLKSMSGNNSNFYICPLRWFLQPDLAEEQIRNLSNCRGKVEITKCAY